jgi:hypothetical protein
MIKSYTIASAYSQDGYAQAEINLIIRVSNLLTEDWQPFGNMVAIQEGKWFVLMQPMALYEKEKKLAVDEGLSLTVHQMRRLLE